MDFTCVAFEKQLPHETADLVVKISARAENRIGLGGSFVSDSVPYEIFGEIVWLPKMDMFRGRPGFNKSLGVATALQHDGDVEIEFRPLIELNSVVHFETWTDYPPKLAADESRTTLSNTITQLLGQSKTSDKIASIRQCIESFNELNHRFNDFIDTELREQIIDAVYEIALASGLTPELAEKLDEWREW